MIIYTAYLMNLTTEDKLNFQLNSSAIPMPRFEFKHKFRLPLGYSVVYVFFLVDTRVT